MTESQNHVVFNVLKDLIETSLKKMADNVNNTGIEAQKQFLLDVCQLSQSDIDAHINPVIKFPGNFQAIKISQYLQGRRYDKSIVKDISAEIGSIMVKYNNKAKDLNEVAVFEFSMSAKHQSMTGCVRGLSSDEAKSLAGYDEEYFIEDNAERFSILANQVSEAIRDAGFTCYDIEEKSYGIYMDLE